MGKRYFTATSGHILCFAQAQVKISIVLAQIHDLLYTISSDCIVGLTPAGRSKEEVLEMYTTWWDGLVSLGINLPFTKFGKALRAREELIEVIREVGIVLSS